MFGIAAIRLGNGPHSSIYNELDIKDKDANNNFLLLTDVK